MDDILSLIVRARDEASAEIGKATKSLGGLHSAAGKVGGGLKAAGGAIVDLGKVAAGAALAGIAALGSQIAFGAKSLVDEQQKMAQTAAVIKSTGGVAKVTQKDIEGLAASLRLKSGIDDQVTRSTANMLLTFTNVRNEAGKGNDVFTRATKTALDMSIALGQDGASSAMQLGKALNDPIKGVTALQRVGVTFTQQQKDQIKTLVEHGKTLDAQKIILGELNREFGGSTVAYGNSAAGAVAKLGLAWGEVQKSLAEAVLPVLLNLSNVLSQQIFPALEPVASLIGGLFADVASQGGDLGVLADDFRELAAQGNPVAQALSPLIDQLLVFQRTAVGPLLDQMKALVPSFLDLAVKAAAFGAQVAKDVAPTVVDIATKLGALATVMVTKVAPVIQDFAIRVWEGGLNKAVAAAGKVISATIGFLTGLATWITSNKPLMDVLRSAADLIGTAFGLAGDAISAVVDWLGKMGDEISANKSAMNFIGGLGKIIGAGFDVARAAIQLVVDAIGTVITKAKEAIDTVSKIPGMKLGGDIAGNVGGAIGNAIGGITNFVGGFATGGVVPGPVGAPALAVVHGGETVTPVGGGGAISVGEVHFHVQTMNASEAEARSFARQLWGYLEEEAFRRGRTLQPVRGGS